MVGGETPASAQAHTLLAHVRAHKEGPQLALPLDVDEAPALAGVAQLLQDVRRLLCHLGAEHRGSTVWLNVTETGP